LHDPSTKLWPFDGSLDALLKPGHLVIAETYPAECYGWFLDQPVVKTSLDSRKNAEVALLAWANTGYVALDPELRKIIEVGFPQGDDAFDAGVAPHGERSSTRRARYSQRADRRKGIPEHVYPANCSRAGGSLIRHRVDENEDFTGEFVKTNGTIEWSASEAGFAFTSSPANTSINVYSVVGHERNGVFFHGRG
jgi:hypothetical protein